LRNDWLLLLGKQRDWNTFSQVYPKFRMRDDKSVTCYALLADALQGRGAPNVGQQVRDLWLAQKDADDGCTTAAGQLYANKLITDADVWRRARVATEANRQKAARDAVAIVAPKRPTRWRRCLPRPPNTWQARARHAGASARSWPCWP
jgi:soluble lytic murein transglycosylase